MSERVEQLLQAGNEASGHVRNLWITFLLFGTYLAIAIGGTTHRQMLLEEPVVLPILGAELPLVHFYQVAPILFLIFHFYLLVQLYLLAQKLHLLEGGITGPAVPKGARPDLRARTDNFLITQLLVGKTGGVLPRLFIRVAAWLTMIFAPVLLLLAFQIRFLPYHDVFTTWLHRGTLIADVLIVWLLCPVITHPGGRLGGAFTAVFVERPLMFLSLRYEWQRQWREAMAAGDVGRAFGSVWRSMRAGVRPLFRFVKDVVASLILLVASFAVIGFSVLVATIPAEEIERWLLDHPLPEETDSATEEPFWWLGPPQFRTLQLARRDALPPFFSFDTWTSKRPRSRPVPVETEPNHVWWPTAILFEGEPDQVSSKVTSLFSRNLVLIDDIDLVRLNDDELKKVDRTLVLRGRDLRYARFDRADLRKADMFEANLTGAVLEVARLEKATLQRAKMQGANLVRAAMQGAYLRRVEMQGAFLAGARLQGADLREARMQGAHLGTARMQGADLRGARMQGTYLMRAEMQGADLAAAFMPGAFLGAAKIQGAELKGVYMQGADLSLAEMQAADLTGAFMPGAVLKGVKMQGAVLKGASLPGAELSGAWIWMTVATNADLALAKTTGVATSDPFTNINPDLRRANAENAISDWLADIPAGDAKDLAERRLAILRDSSSGTSGWRPWTNAKTVPPVQWTETEEQHLARIIHKGCRAA